MMEVWGMQTTPSLLSLPGPLCPEVVALHRGPICGSNRNKQCTYAELNIKNRIVFNIETVYLC